MNVWKSALSVLVSCSRQSTSVFWSFTALHTSGRDACLIVLLEKREFDCRIGSFAKFIFGDNILIEVLRIVVVVVIVTSVKPEGLEDHVGAMLVCST